MQLNMFIASLVPCKQLHTIVDARDLAVHLHYHGQSLMLTAVQVKGIMQEVTSVQKIFNGNRCWTVRPFPVDHSANMNVEAFA